MSLITREVGDTAKNERLTNAELDNNLIYLEEIATNNSAGFYTNNGYTNNGDGTVSIPENTVLLYDNSSNSGNPLTFTLAPSTFDIVEVQTNYIVADYNSGVPIYRVTLDVNEINESDIIPYLTVFRSGAETSIISWDNLAKGLVNKIHHRLVKTNRFEFETLATPQISEGVGQSIIISDCIVWNGANRSVLDPLNSTVDSLMFWYHDTGGWTKTQVTSYNNQYYDNGADLVLVNPNRFVVNWVYRGICDCNKFAYVLDNQSYSTITNAAYSAPRTDLPENLVTQATLVGRIIVERGATTASKVDSGLERDFKTLSLLKV